MTSMIAGGPGFRGTAALRRIARVASDREVQQLAAEFARSCAAAYPLLRVAAVQGGQMVRRIAMVWLG